MQRVVVTGGTGFIGSWLIRELTDRDIEVVALVRAPGTFDKMTGENIQLLHSVVYDSAEYEALKQSNKKIDVFYHLAWAGVSSELKNECDIQLDNIRFSLQMLDYAKEINAERFIGIGTVAEYAFCESIMDVNARQTPSDMYGAAKTAAHYMLETRARMLQMPFNWTVIPSTFGEGRKDNNIITYTITSLLRGRKPSYGSLQQMWDFLYVREVVRALYMIGDKGVASKCYGIGSGVFKPLKEYIMIIRDMVNPKLELGIGDIPAYSEKVFSSCVSIYDLTKKQ